MAKKRLTADEILALVDVEEQDVYVKEWDTDVTITPFTKDEQQKMRKSATVDGEIDQEKLEMALFVSGVTSPKFTKDQIEALRQKNANAIDTVLKAIMEASGITESEAKEIKKD